MTLLDHKHGPLHTHTFHGRRSQKDEHCRKSNCSGIARVQMAYAPDTGFNWVKCCCCGDYWNPGSRG